MFSCDKDGNSCRPYLCDIGATAIGSKRKVCLAPAYGATE